MQAEQQIQDIPLENGDADGSSDEDFMDEADVYEAGEDRLQRKTKEIMLMTIEKTTEAVNNKVNKTIDKIESKMDKLIDNYVSKRTCAYVYPHNYHDIKLRRKPCGKDCLSGSKFCSPDHKRVGNQALKRKAEREKKEREARKNVVQEHREEVTVVFPSIPDAPSGPVQIVSDGELEKKVTSLATYAISKGLKEVQKVGYDQQALDAKHAHEAQELDRLLNWKQLEKEAIAKYKGTTLKIEAGEEFMPEEPSWISQGTNWLKKKFLG
jgi:hypothetical protein